MQMTYSRIDLNACAASKHEPQVIIERRPDEVWLVPDREISLQAPISWCRFHKEQHVLIPLVPYLINPEPDLALAFAFSLGARVSYDLGRPVIRLHIATGVPVDAGGPETNDQLRYWLGFGVVTQR